MEQRKFANQKAGTFPPALADKSALSRFMKEILAENGHLQLGAAELRDMLTQSQEEVNMLRHKLEGMESAEYGVPIDMEIPLNMELARTPTQPSGVVGGVVVHHHHYHSPNNAAKEKSAMKPQIRQPRKKKNVTINHFNTIQVRGFTVENSGSKRWSSSTGPPSSSPTSTFHESSIFDRVEAGNDTSRPTSADSNYPPPWPKWSKHHRSASSNPPPFTILHTTEEVPSEPGSPVHPPPEISMSPSYQSLQLPTLKRAISHESILSVSALDTTVFLAAHSATSSFVSRRPGGGRLRRGGTIKANDPQASITHGTAIRDNGGSQWSGDAYSRLLGLHQAEGTSPPTNGRPPLTKKSTSSSSSNSNNNAASRLWKYVTLAPGFKQVKAEEPTHAKIKKMFTKPVVGLVDEDLLREALGDGPGLFVGGSGLL